MKLCHLTVNNGTEDPRVFYGECFGAAQNQENEVILIGNEMSTTKDNIKVIGVPERGFTRLNKLVSFAPRCIDEAVKLKADIYHIHNIEFLPYIDRLLKTGAKVIYDCNEDPISQLRNVYNKIRFSRRIISSIYYGIINKYTPKADALILSDETLSKLFSNYNKRIIFVRNYPLNILQSLKPYSKKETFTFVFDGGINRNWCHREFIEAMDGILNIQYRMFGEVDDLSYMKSLHKLNAWNKVYYGGKIPYEQMQEEIKQADVVVSLLRPSKSTNFTEGNSLPRIIYEALANGKPVLATNFTKWEEEIVKNQLGVCAFPSSLEKIKEAIRYFLLLEDSDMNQIGENAIEYCKKNCVWEKEQQKLDALYSELFALKCEEERIAAAKLKEKQIKREKNVFLKFLRKTKELIKIGSQKFWALLVKGSKKLYRWIKDFIQDKINKNEKK